MLPVWAKVISKFGQVVEFVEVEAKVLEQIAAVKDPLGTRVFEFELWVGCLWARQPLCTTLSHKDDKTYEIQTVAVGTGAGTTSEESESAI